MRSTIINESSKLSDVMGVLTGAWYEYDRRGWHVVKTPFMLAMAGSFTAGTVELPLVPSRFGIARWANDTTSGMFPVKPKQTNIVLTDNAFVEIVIYGVEDK